MNLIPHRFRLIPLIMLFLFGCIWVGLPQVGAQSTKTTLNRAYRIQQIFNREHWLAPTLNDTFSFRLHDRLIEALDENGLYLTEVEVEQLAGMRLGWDDAILTLDQEPLEELTQVVRSSLERADSIVALLADQGLTWSGEELMHIRIMQGTNRPINHAALFAAWDRYVAYQVLLLVEDREELNQLDQTFRDSALVLQQPIVKRIGCRIDRRIAEVETFVGETFLEILASTYDPHSAYFSMSGKTSFEQSLSSEAMSYGLELSMNRSGEIAIDRLVPGGSAWHSNVLHQGDVLLEIALGRKEPVSLLCQSLRETEEMLTDTRYRDVRLLVRKQNGQTQWVSLRKRPMQVDENVITSFVLGSEPKVGYIYLPGFYVDMENEQGLGCANDMAKEILMLQLEGVEGLILDLRFNGGGSMKEAIDLAGLFIDEGPILYNQERGEDPYVQRDFNRGAAYEGPLLVMVNRTSASASEVLAGTLQDYQRALIVGTPTYGKSTSQYIRPLYERKPAEGYVKVTASALGRVSGKSHQGIGVIPDILLPETLALAIPGEGRDSLALPPISNLVPAQYDLAGELPIGQLDQFSVARIEAKEPFSTIMNQAESLQAQLASGFRIRLNPAFFREDMATLRQIYTGTDELGPTKLEVSNNRLNRSLVQMNADWKRINDEQLSRIQTDVYIEEAYLIMVDWLRLEP